MSGNSSQTAKYGIIHPFASLQPKYPSTLAPSDVNSNTNYVQLTPAELFLRVTPNCATRTRCVSSPERKNMAGIDVTQYLNMVEQEARHLCRTRPSTYSLEYGDFYGAGCVGLVQAADKWVPELTSAPFSAYARKWVRGHMYKLLRQELRAHCRSEPMWPMRRQTGQSRRDWRPGRKLLQIEDVEPGLPGENSQEDKILLQIVLQELPEIESKVLYLRHFAGYDGKRTAQLLGLRGGSSVVSVIKKRATIRLQERLGVASGLEHGTLDTYRYCKCEVCREEKAKQNSEEWKRRKKLQSTQKGGRGKSRTCSPSQDGLEVSRLDDRREWKNHEYQEEIALAS